MKVLIIDDEVIRVPALTKYIETRFGKCEVIHSVTFTLDWDGYFLVMLDHDLGKGGDVSRHVSKAFPRGYTGSAEIVVHSMNPVGARNIINALGTGNILPYSAILSRIS